MIWRERQIPLIVMAALLLGNLFFFFTYRVQYQSRLNDQEQRLAESEKRLQDAQSARAAAEAQLAGYDKVTRDLQMLYNDRWSTQAKRFTLLFLEVKRLVTASHFDPRSFSFSRADTKGTRDAPEGNTEVGVTFNVQGTYEQVRQLINLLELSDQFMIIEGISLGGADAKMLNMNIRLKTLFREPVSPNARRPNRQL